MGEERPGKPERSINFKYMLFILLVTFCFLIAIFVVSFLTMRSFSLEMTEGVAVTILDSAENRIRGLFEDLEALSKGIAGTRAVKSADPDGMRDLFVSTVLAWKRYLRAVYLGTADGRMYEWGHGREFKDYTPTFPPGYDPRVRPWYVSAMKSEGFSVSAPYRYASVDALGITCVLQVKGRDGKTVGVLGFDILLENLKTILDDLKIPKRGHAFILGENGEIIAEGGGTEASKELPLKRFEAPDIADHLRRSEGSFKMKTGGQETLYYYRKSESVGWFLVVAVPYEEIMVQVRRLLAFITIIEVLLMAMLTAALSVISNRLISAPLHGIVSVINRIEGGEKGARVKVKSNDEFALLGRELNKLVDAVAEYSSSLESKVQERTEELRGLQQENTRLRIAEERKRIYRDMHDSIGAKLTNIFFCNNVARSAIGREPERLPDLFEGIESNCLGAMKNLKEIIGDLRGEDSLRSGSFVIRLSEGIRSRLRTSRTELAYEVAPADLEDRLLPEVRVEISMIIDELVSNVLKHSEASRVSFALEAEGSNLRLFFKDDGRGFDVREVESKGSGLSNIEFRVKHLGGDLDIRSESGKGTAFSIRIPLDAPPAREEI